MSKNVGSKVVGIRPYKFTPADRPEVLEGYTVWLLEEVRDAIGLIPFKASFSKNRMFDLVEASGLTDLSELIGCTLDLKYDRYGKVAGFDVLSVG